MVGVEEGELEDSDEMVEEGMIEDEDMTDEDVGVAIVVFVEGVSRLTVRVRVWPL